MQEKDLEVLGAVFELIMEEQHYSRIQPHLTYPEYHDFMLHYIGRCSESSPLVSDGLNSSTNQWIDSKYTAGHKLLSWFIGCWKDETVPRQAIDEIKNWLAQIYRDGNNELRTCIVNSTLEHLFEHPKLRQYFSDWQNDPILMRAHHQALEWVRAWPQKYQLTAQERIQQLPTYD